MLSGLAQGVPNFHLYIWTAIQSETKNYHCCDSIDIFLRKSQTVAFGILNATEDQMEEKLKHLEIFFKRNPRAEMEIQFAFICCHWSGDKWEICIQRHHCGCAQAWECICLYEVPCNILGSHWPWALAVLQFPGHFLNILGINNFIIFGFCNYRN